MSPDLATTRERRTVSRQEHHWRGLLLLGGWAALVNVGLIVVQIVVFLRWPPPTTTTAFFVLLLDRPLLGLVSLDLLFIVSNLLVCLLYLALGVALWDTSRSAVVVALALALLGMSAYLASPRAVEMLTLAHAYRDGSAAEQALLRAVGDGMLATWSGTAYNIYYVLNAIALMILAIAMLRSSAFGKAVAVWGVTAAALMIVPGTAGTIGLAFSLASLLPWSVFSLLTAGRLRRLARDRSS